MKKKRQKRSKILGTMYIPIKKIFQELKRYIIGPFIAEPKA